MTNEQLTSLQPADLIQIFLMERTMATCIYLASYKYLLQVRVEHVGWHSLYSVSRNCAQVMCSVCKNHFYTVKPFVVSVIYF